MSSATALSVDLAATAQAYREAAAHTQQRVIVCAGTGCIANGSLDVQEAFVREIEAAGINVFVELKRSVWRQLFLPVDDNYNSRFLWVGWARDRAVVVLPSEMCMAAFGGPAGAAVRSRRKPFAPARAPAFPQSGPSARAWWRC